MKQAYFIEVGVLLKEDDEEFDNYAEVYDKKHSFFDEDQYAVEEFEQAKKDVQEYVKDGVDRTYGIVCDFPVEDDFNFEEDEIYVDMVMHAAENVLYSVAKKNGELIENFLE